MPSRHLVDAAMKRRHLLHVERHRRRDRSPRRAAAPRCRRRRASRPAWETPRRPRETAGAGGPACRRRWLRGAARPRSRGHPRPARRPRSAFRRARTPARSTSSSASLAPALRRRLGGSAAATGRCLPASRPGLRRPPSPTAPSPPRPAGPGGPWAGWGWRWPGAGRTPPRGGCASSHQSLLRCS